MRRATSKSQPETGAAAPQDTSRARPSKKSVTIRSKSVEPSGLPTPATTGRKPAKSATQQPPENSPAGDQSPSQGRSQDRPGDDDSTATESEAGAPAGVPPPSAQPQRKRKRKRAVTAEEVAEEEEAVFDPETDWVKDFRFEWYLNDKYCVSRLKSWKEYKRDEWMVRHAKVLGERFAVPGMKEVQCPRGQGPEIFIYTGNRTKKLQSRWTEEEESLTYAASRFWELMTFQKFQHFEIEVVVKFFYTAAVSLEVSDSESTEDEFAGLDSIQTRRRRSKGKKKKNKAPTASQRQRQSTQNDRLIEDLTGNYLNRLLDYHTCKIKSCKNSTRPCVAVPGYGHCQLTTPAVKKWNQMIRDGVARMEDCPASVMEDLVTEDMRTNTRKPISKVAGGGVGDSHPAVIQYFGGSGPGVAGNSEVARSSPPERLGDDDMNMKHYLAWLGRKYPQQSGEFDIHQVTLCENGWGFSDLREVTDDQWKDMRIGGGFAKKIRKHLKEYARRPPSRESEGQQSDGGMGRHPGGEY